MGLLGDWFGGKRIKEPVRGTAQVVSCSMWHGGTTGNCNFTLVVKPEGMEPFAREYACLVSVKKWPSPGQVLPITVDRRDPQRMRIEWDEVPEAGETSMAEAEAIARALGAQGGAGPASDVIGALQAGGANVAGPIVIQQDSRTLDASSPEGMAILDSLKARGLDLTGLAGSVQVHDSGEGDIAEKLEKLARLHTAGVLSDEEFEQAKQRVIAS